MLASRQPASKLQSGSVSIGDECWLHSLEKKEDKIFEVQLGPSEKTSVSEKRGVVRMVA